MSICLKLYLQIIDSDNIPHDDAIRAVADYTEKTVEEVEAEL